jgi:hypothetical protein
MKVGSILEYKICQILANSVGVVVAVAAVVVAVVVAAVAVVARVVAATQEGVDELGRRGLLFIEFGSKPTSSTLRKWAFVVSGDCNATP